MALVPILLIRGGKPRKAFQVAWEHLAEASLMAEFNSQTMEQWTSGPALYSCTAL